MQPRKLEKSRINLIDVRKSGPDCRCKEDKVETGNGKRSFVQSLNRLRKENGTTEEESRNKWGEGRDWKVAESGGRFYRIHLIIPYTALCRGTCDSAFREKWNVLPIISDLCFAPLQHLAKVPLQPRAAVSAKDVRRICKKVSNGLGK